MAHEILLRSVYSHGGLLQVPAGGRDLAAQLILTKLEEREAPLGIAARGCSNSLGT